MSDDTTGAQAADDSLTPGTASSDGVDRIQQAWLRERPGTPVESIGVITRVWRIAKLLEDERRRTSERLGIDAATRDLLSTLRRAGPPYRLSPGELAHRTLVSAGAISQRVSRAERAGFVRREKAQADKARSDKARSDSARSDKADSGDGRAVEVTLTAEGHAFIEQSVDALLRHEETLLDSLTPTQREELAGLLRVLLAGLTERFGMDDRPTPAPAK